MSRARRYDLAILGAGTAGIVAARIAAAAGARVALIEGERIGGECLYTGCVPSKALLAAAERAEAVRTASELGVIAGPPRIEFQGVMAHVRSAIEKAGHEDTPEFLRSRGVDVIEAPGRFTGPGEISAGARLVRYRAALIATGSRPAIPAIERLDEIAALTNETVFDLESLPVSLAVIGGGPTGCELGQAFARLGTEVKLLESSERLLAGAEPWAAEMVAESLRADGVEVVTGTTIERAEQTGRGRSLALAGGARISAEQVLVATGRRPTTTEIGLERVGVETDEQGAVIVDDRLRTTGNRIYAAGDVTGAPELTHFAAYQALIALANALFRARRRVERDWTPWAVFTDPEIAQVGLTEQEAREIHGAGVETYDHDYGANDRAITAGRASGRARLVVDRKGRLVGAAIVAPAAGESIAEVARLVRERAKVRSLSEMIHVYPTLTEGPARAADEYWERHVLTGRARRFLRPSLAILRLLDRPR